MKKTVLMFAAAALMLATPSCKKGENDPFISFLSRKARFSGEWAVSSMSSKYTTTSGDWSSTTEEEFDGTTLTTTNSTTNGGTTTSTTDTRTVSKDDWTINKDGTFTREYDYTEVDENDNGWSTTTTTTTVTSTTSGTWSFVGKVKDEYKKKERVVFNILDSKETEDNDWVTTLNSDGSQVDSGSDSESTAYTYSHGEVIWAADLDQLKNKEMIWVMKGDGTSSISQTSGNTTTTTTSTTTGMETWTFTAK